MTDLPLTTDLSDLPIGTLLRRRDGQVRKMVAKTSNHPDSPIVLDDGYCIAKNGKASNWPIGDIIGIAAWPSLDRPRHYFVAYVKLDAVGKHKFIGQLFYEAIYGSPATDDLFVERIKQRINEEFPEQSDLNCIITNLNELQP
jgi:hypothetical protein